MSTTETMAVPPVVPASGAFGREVVDLVTLRGPLRFAGIALTDYTLTVRDGEGRLVELAIDEAWRIEGLIERFSPRDAYRIGLFWSEWRERRTREEIAATGEAS